MVRRRLLCLLVIASMPACASSRARPEPQAQKTRSSLNAMVRERWRVALPTARVGIPEVGRDAIYVTTADSVVALRHDGAPLWSTPMPDGTRIFAPRLHGDVVVVAGERGVVALQRGSGEALWRFETGERVHRPAIEAGLVVATTAGGRVVGLDLTTGTLRWDTKMATDSGAQVAVADGVAVVVGLGEWAGFDLRDGHTVWSGDLGLIGTSSPAIAPTAEGLVAVVASQDKLIAVGLHDGQLRWEAKAEQAELAQVPVVRRGEILVPDHWGRLCAYRPDDGRVLWKTHGADGVALWGEPVVLGARRVALALAKDGPRIASPQGALALRPPSPGMGVARLGDGAVVVSTYGQGQNYLVAYDLDVGLDLGAGSQTR